MFPSLVNSCIKCLIFHTLLPCCIECRFLHLYLQVSYVNMYVFLPAIMLLLGKLFRFASSKPHPHVHRTYSDLSVVTRQGGGGGGRFTVKGQFSKPDYLASVSGLVSGLCLPTCIGSCMIAGGVRRLTVRPSYFRNLKVNSVYAQLNGCSTWLLFMSLVWLAGRVDKTFRCTPLGQEASL